MKFLGLEMAPVSIPLERRLQTGCALFLTSSFLFVGVGMFLLCVYLLFTSYFFLPLAYLAWHLYDRQISARGGRRWNLVRRMAVWRYTAQYFPINLIKLHELHPSKNYILACHPHGIMSQSHMINFATEGTGFSELFPAITPYLCTLRAQFMFPIFRDLILLFGALDVSKESLEWVLTKEGTGNALAIVVGGAMEALDAQPRNFRLTLKSRKGFCRLALKHGASLVPVYAFGETDLYEQVPNPPGSLLRRFQTFITHLLGISPPMFHGRGVFNYTFGILPYRKPVTTVVGAPMDVTRHEDPTQQEVDQLHSRYCDALIDLFETHKLTYGLAESDHLDLE